MFPLFRSGLLALCLACAIPLAAIAGDPLWIDVRSAQEFSEGHVEQSINIPHDEIATGISKLTSDKEAVIYVYCRSGRRSGIAKETLESLGYTGVVNQGGLDDALAKSGRDISY